MVVTFKSREFNKIEEYLMTISKDALSVKDIEDGEKITVTGYLEYEDTNSKGEDVRILSIITPEKKVYSTQSETFKESIRNMAGLMGGENFTIIKKSGTTKAGRPYVDCSLDTSNM